MVKDQHRKYLEEKIFHHYRKVNKLEELIIKSSELLIFQMIHSPRNHI